MIIDGHSHVTFPPEEHIQAMNQAGIDKTVLFSTTFHPEAAKNATEAKEAMQYLQDLLGGRKGPMTEIRKKANAELSDAIRRFPDRYLGFGAVPTGIDLESTLAYVSENIYERRLSGIGEFTLGSNQAYWLENIFKASAEFYNLPLWIHAFAPFTLQDIRDTADMARKYSRTPVILGHLGGTNWMEAMELAGAIPNLYLDTSAYYSTYILGVVIGELPEKCIFGADRPFGDVALCKDAILKLSKTPETARKVLGENIAGILGI